MYTLIPCNRVKIYQARSWENTAGREGIDLEENSVKGLVLLEPEKEHRLTAVPNKRAAPSGMFAESFLLWFRSGSRNEHPTGDPCSSGISEVTQLTSRAHLWVTDP